MAGNGRPGPRPALPAFSSSRGSSQQEVMSGRSHVSRRRSIPCAVSALTHTPDRPVDHRLSAAGAPFTKWTVTLCYGYRITDTLNVKINGIQSYQWHHHQPMSYVASNICRAL